MLKTLERIVLKYLIQIVYLISKIMPVKKRIVFATYRTLELKDNFKFIYDEVKRQELDYETKFLFKKLSPGIMGRLDYLVHLCEATYYLATSQYFLIDDYYYPVYVVKLRKGTEVVQVWHACGAFKKFGYSVIDKEYGADNNYIKYVSIHTNYSHVLVSSKEVVHHYAEAFNMDEKNILPIGVPRTDIFFDDIAIQKAKRNLYELYPCLKNKKLVLYAPTFRGASQHEANMSVPFNIQEVLSAIGEDAVLGFKMHPFVKDLPNLDAYENAVDLSTYGEVNEILLLADILITDYSSLVFEFSLLERPMIFYTDDLERYESERDFYYKYEELVPGPIVSTTDELVDVLQKDEYDMGRIKAFKHKFFDDTDGLASKRFVDTVILKK